MRLACFGKSVPQCSHDFAASRLLRLHLTQFFLKPAFGNGFDRNQAITAGSTPRISSAKIVKGWPFFR